MEYLGKKKKKKTGNGDLSLQPLPFIVKFKSSASHQALLNATLLIYSIVFFHFGLFFFFSKNTDTAIDPILCS